MIALTLAEIAAATLGELHLDDTDASPETIVDGAVTTDSREVVPGGVFVAKRGEFDDGHRDTDYRYDVSLPKLARALSSDPKDIV